MSLILKLDESVSDDSLPKLGEMFFDVKSNSNFTFSYVTQGNAEYTARIIGTGNFFTDNTYTTSAGTTVTQTTGSLYLSSGTYKVGITQKYIVRELGNNFGLADTGAIEFDCSNMKYCDYNFALNASHWKIENFSAENMQKCVLINASGAVDMEVDVEEFKGLSNDLYSVNIGTTSCYGDAVDAFGNKTSLSLLVFGTTSCTGTYGDICDAMFSNGRTSGTMTILANDGTGVHTVTFSENGWTAS